MNSIQTAFHWFTQNPLAAAAFFVGGPVLAVTLYTYVYDYTMLSNRD